MPTIIDNNISFFIVNLIVIIAIIHKDDEKCQIEIEK